MKLALPNLRVLVENNTSAMDAIQKVTGTCLAVGWRTACPTPLAKLSGA